MDWYDVYDVLRDGTKDEILKLCCPDCGHSIEYKFYPESDVFTQNVFIVRCRPCGYYSKGHGGPFPNCVKFFGDSATIGDEGKE